MRKPVLKASIGETSIEIDSNFRVRLEGGIIGPNRIIGSFGSEEAAKSAAIRYLINQAEDMVAIRQQQISKLREISTRSKFEGTELFKRVEQ